MNRNLSVADNIHLALGNPSYAVALPADRYHLFQRFQYVLLYDRTTNAPAWASWQLNASWLGNLSRPEFTLDPEMPTGWFTVTPRSYTGSGFGYGSTLGNPFALPGGPVSFTEGGFFNITPVPEPASVVLLAMGVASTLMWRRRAASPR